MRRWLIWGIFAVVWTTLLLLPGSQLAALEELPPFLKVFITKTGHVLAYGLFAFLSGWVQVPMRYRWVLLFFIMAHGTSTELLQQKITWRTGTLEDVGLDHAGVLLGLLAGWKWWTAPE